MFRAQDDTPIARVWGYNPDRTRYHRTYLMRSKSFRAYIKRVYYDSFQSALGDKVLDAVLGILEARADLRPDLPVGIRVGEYQGKYYLDLGRANWEAVELAPSGSWSVVPQSPIAFIRPPGMLPLPIPTQPPADGVNRTPSSILRQILNLHDQDSIDLILAWVLGAMRPTGPYPILVLSGTEDAGKSTAARLIKSIIDPNAVNIRGLPASEQDLLVSANAQWILNIDNLSALPDPMSDALCRISTGTGIHSRERYTDFGIVAAKISRPIILNGIRDFASRPDLLSRSVAVTLPKITKYLRRAESTLEARFYHNLPYLLAGLCDAIAGALCLGIREAEPGPRMLDWAALVDSCGPFLGWSPGRFGAVHAKAQMDNHDTALDASPIGRLIIQIVHQNGGEWSGTMTHLLSRLNSQATLDIKKEKTWPKSPYQLTWAVRKLESALQNSAGITVQYTRRGHANERYVTLSRSA